MGLVSEEVEVCVEGMPHFSHSRTSVSILPSILLITRLAPGPAARASQVDSNGAHFKIQFPAEIVFQCLERAESFFRFEGPFLGTMDGRANRAALDDGPSSHAITKSTLLLAVVPDKNLFQLEIAGTLSPMRPIFDYWPTPLPLSSFTIKAPLPLDEMATMFSGSRDVVQPRIDKALARLSEGRR